MRRHVLVISNMYPSAVDRCWGVFVERSVDGLRAAGVDVQTVVLPRQRRSWTKLAAYARFAWQANRALLGGKHDCVWIHQPLHSLLVALPALWLRRVPLALSFHGHDLLPVTRRGRLLRRLLHGELQRADRLIVPSPHFRRIAVAAFRRDALVFASGGVDGRHFAAAPALAERPRGVLFLARWVAGKGWPTFIAVAARLAADDAGLVFTLAGGGADAARIRAAVVAAGLDVCLRVVETADAAANVALLRSHRYVVTPTDFDESLGLVNLEAMASGCVVISRDFAAARDYIGQGISGFRFAAAMFVDDCAATVARLEGDLAAAQRIADAARAAAAPYAEHRVLAALPALLGLQALS